MLWTFKDSSWKQDHDLETFRVESIFGQECQREPIAPLDMLIGAKAHPAHGVPCEKSRFPSEFKNCPYCGCLLTSQHNETSSLWVPPYGSRNGLKLLSAAVATADATRAARSGSKFTLPTRDGRFAFCSLKLGAQQRLLVAVKRDTGQLWVYRPDDEEWQAFSGLAGGDSLPSWSWSLAVDQSESGIALPTDQGPVWLTVDWASGSILLDRAAGRSIGGSASVGGYVLAPVMHRDGLSIMFRKAGEGAWSECSSTSEPGEVLTQLRGASLEDVRLGIPVLDENRQIVYWPGRRGFVRVSGFDSAAGLCWEFRPYETDEYPATALIELGPPYRKTGSRPGLWQLCEDRDPSVRDGIVNKIIKLDGDEQVDSEIVECGQFLTTGRASFAWGDDYWEDIHKRNPRIGEQQELRLPLLQFGERGVALIAKAAPWEGRDELGIFSDLFFNRNLKARTFVRFVIEGAGTPEIPLYAEEVDGVHGGNSGSLFPVKIADLPELSAFVYRRSLYLYLPETNDCFCWPLQLMEG